MIEEYIKKIISSLLFLRLKDVVENNGYHDHEVVYDHLIKTKDIAQREIKGDFIANPEAKKLFLKFVNEDFYILKRVDIMILIALLHDIGKILTVYEGDTEHPLLATNSSGITFCPGHEFWGSTIIGEILNDLALPEEVINYIATIIKLHDTFSDSYWKDRKEWLLEQILNDVKSRAGGFYKEALFNIYCDCFNAKPFEYGKSMIIKIFNEPSLYIKREYVIT